MCGVTFLSGNPLGRCVMLDWRLRIRVVLLIVLWIGLFVLAVTVIVLSLACVALCRCRYGCMCRCRRRVGLCAIVTCVFLLRFGILLCLDLIGRLMGTWWVCVWRRCLFSILFVEFGGACVGCAV